MNKRVKIVATLGPAVEIRGGKKFGEDGYWGEKLDVELRAQISISTLSNVLFKKGYFESVTNPPCIHRKTCKIVCLCDYLFYHWFLGYRVFFIIAGPTVVELYGADFRRRTRCVPISGSWP